MLNDILLLKSHEIIKLFLNEKLAMATVLDLAVSAKKSVQTGEDMFNSVKAEDKKYGRDFAGSLLHYLDEWNNALGKDSKQSRTYFWLMWRSVNEPEQVGVNMGMTSVKDMFDLTEKDALLKRYSEYLAVPGSYISNMIIYATR